MKEKQKSTEEKCEENRKMERSKTSIEPRGSPAGLNNTEQNAVGHPSPRFLNQREMVRVDERKEEWNRREEGRSSRDFCLSVWR